MKRIWLWIFAITMVLTALMPVQAVSDPAKTDYFTLMMESARDGSEQAMLQGQYFEKLRNQKIISHDLPYACTSFFTDYESGELQSHTVLTRMITSQFTEEDVDLLARIIQAEAGSSHLPDELQLYVGSVVLNRIANPKFPGTLYDVIYQPGQYTPTRNGAINNTPDERTYENARWLVENGSICPINVVWQAEFKQGKSVYWSHYNEASGTTTYICAS